MSDHPELVQFGDLTAAHFERVPVWIQCHVVDYDEPWHDLTDEETFRPRLGALPASPEEGMLLVRASLRLADGTTLPGFVTPAHPGPDPLGLPPMATLQPNVFLPSGAREAFWGGVVDRIAENKQRFYREAARGPDAVFPITFAAEPGLCDGTAGGTIEGFYVMHGRRPDVRVER